MKITVLRNNRTIADKKFSPENSDILLIGRSRDCHIVLDDRKVSRIHAEIVSEETSWKIRAKNKDGMLDINGIVQEEKQLGHADILKAGPFDIKIELPVDILETAGVEQTETVSPSPTEGDGTTLEEFATEGEEGEFAAEDEQEEFGTEAEEGDFSTEEGQDGFDTEGEGEGFSTEDEYEENTVVASGFASYTLEIFGEHAPYDAYKIEDAEVLIGRDPDKCHILLRDPEVSSLNTAIKKSDSQITIEDIESSNGTILNGKRINKAVLQHGDEFVIGSTSFSYKVKLDLLAGEEQRLMPVEENQSIEIEEIVEVEEDFEEDASNQNIASPTSQSLFSKEAMKDPEKRKKIMMIAVVLAGLWLVLEEEEPSPKKAAPQKEKMANNEADSTETTTEAATKRSPSQDGQEKALSKQGTPLTKEQLEQIEQQYVLTKETFAQQKYQETLFELDKIFQVVDQWKESRQIEALAKEGLKKIEELEKKRKEEEERRQRAIRIQEMLTKAKKAVEERKVQLAGSFFAEILKLEPDNFDVPQLKLELDTWQEEEERKRVEAEAKKVERQRKVDQLSPGKNDYLQKKWYSAILRLESFLKISNMDEDLIKEATTMLEMSKAELKKLVDPLISKARSLREGQDLKGAYEHYNRALVFDPSTEEALNEVNRISEILNRRARNVYIEGLIAENLSMFKEAKEKFQEVQQISPSDSGYYKKASDKLRDYFD